MNKMFSSLSVVRFGITEFSVLLKNSGYNFTKSKKNLCLLKTMPEWQNEKEKHLKMDKEEKRKFLNSSGRRYQTVENIPTWAEYFKNKQQLPEKIDILGGYQIDPSKNHQLAGKISIFKGDITTLEMDCIVNAANNSLLGGGGVDGAIHHCAGPELKAECKTLQGCKTGEAKITGGYKLPSRYIIHTVGPKGERPDLLTLCYKNCLQIMFENQLKTIAFPCISTGVYGYPIDRAVHVSNRTVREFLEKKANEVDRIVFCLFGDDDVDIYEKALQSYFPVE